MFHIAGPLGHALTSLPKQGTAAFWAAAYTIPFAAVTFPSRSVEREDGTARTYRLFDGRQVS